MNNLIFCLNATIPIFFLMVLGYLFKCIKIFSDDFVKTANSFVFKIALPVLVFLDLARENFYDIWNGTYVLFCFIATFICIIASIITAFLFKDRSTAGEFAQASYRSSAALLGIGFIQNIYGTSGMAPLMIIGTVPLYNVMAVLILSFLTPDISSGKKKLDKRLLHSTFIGVVKNPIIIGIALGLGWSLLKLPVSAIMDKTLTYVGNLATPLGIMAMGAGFEFKKVEAVLQKSLLASFYKLMLWCTIFLPIAARFGFRDSELIAILVMLGSPSTISCYVMAKNMGHEGSLTTMTVMLTSLISAFTLTFWLYILKTHGLIAG